MAKRHRMSAGAMGIFLLALLSVITQVVPVKAEAGQQETQWIAIATRDIDLTAYHGYTECTYNMELGLERLGNPFQIDAKSTFWYNESIGSMEVPQGATMDHQNFVDAYDVPAGCLCDLATHLYYLAKDGGLTPGADVQEENHVVNVPGLDVVIWHINGATHVDPPAGEENMWIENPNDFPVRIRWEATSTVIHLWLEAPQSQIVVNIGQLPFVQDMRTNHVLSGNLEGIHDLNPTGIVWHQTATGPIDATDTPITGVRLAQIEANRGDTRPGYHVVVGLEEVEVEGETYAVAQWLIPTDVAAWHALDEYNFSHLAISYVDSVKDGPPTPAQLRTMYAITAVWMSQFSIPTDRVIGHKETGQPRSDPVGVDMDEVRSNLGGTGVTTYYQPNYLTSASSAVSTDGQTERQTSIVLPSWVNWEAPPWAKAFRVVYIFTPVAIVVSLTVVAGLYDSNKRAMRRTKKRLRKERRHPETTLLGIRTRASEEKEKALKRKHRQRRRTAVVLRFGLVVLLIVGFEFILAIVLYQPIIPRAETIVVVDPVVVNPPELSVDSTIWQEVANQAGYEDPDLLATFVEHDVPRGSDGYPASDGKIFPWWVAASIPQGETNTADWNNPDPRQPGPWGHYLGWYEAANYFDSESMIQGCRDGLEAIASNPIVQAKWPGITAQQIYTSRGCAVGRGQTLALHFRPGGLASRLTNMDVWSDNDVAVEVVYIHLVSRASSTCGATENWYYTGNVEVALCSYNPNAWGLPQYQWYWDAIRAMSGRLQTAYESGDYTLPATTTLPVVTTGSSQPVQMRPTVGSGPYAIWETIPSLTLRWVRNLPDGTWIDAAESVLIWIGQHVYSPDSQVMLGFTTSGGDTP